jgi:MFS family permease
MMLPEARNHLTWIKLVFCLQPVGFGAWLPRIPEVQAGLGLDARGLAFALAGMPVGILLTLPFAGSLVARLGPRRMMQWLLPVFAAFVVLPAWSASPVHLFVSLLMLGSAMSLLELAMNVEADRIEKAVGAHIMNMCHGFWSLGMLGGSVIGSGLSQLAVPPGWSVLLVSGAMLPCAFWAASQLPAFHTDARQQDTVSSSRFPSAALLGIAFFVFGITLTEGAIADWSAVFLHDVFSATGAAAGLGYIAFAAMLTLMRFKGDALKMRYSAVRLARASCLIALAGIAIVCLSPVLGVATFGFALVGIGAAVGFPLAVSAAAQLTDRPVASSVAIVSFVALIGFLAGPVLIGTTAHYLGMRSGLSVLAPILLVSFVLAAWLSPRAAIEKALA